MPTFFRSKVCVCVCVCVILWVITERVRGLSKTKTSHTRCCLLRLLQLLLELVELLLLRCCLVVEMKRKVLVLLLQRLVATLDLLRYLRHCRRVLCDQVCLEKKIAIFFGRLFFFMLCSVFFFLPGTGCGQTGTINQQSNISHKWMQIRSVTPSLALNWCRRCHAQQRALNGFRLLVKFGFSPSEKRPGKLSKETHVECGSFGPSRFQPTCFSSFSSFISCSAIDLSTADEALAHDTFIAL